MTGPIPNFALIFGKSLSQSYDVTSATTTVTSVYGTVFYMTGLLANFLLQKLPHRKVAVIATITYCIGSFASIFASSLQSLVVSYGILQGLGTGLMLPCLFAIVHAYFDRREMFAVVLGETLTATLSIVFPSFIRFLLSHYDFRGAQAVIAAVNLHAIVATFVFHPAEYHWKRKVKENEIELGASLKHNRTHMHEEPLSIPEEKAKLKRKSIHGRDEYEEEVKIRANSSLTSGSSKNEMPIPTNKRKNFIHILLNLRLLRDIWYWNIVIGLSLCISSDMNFTAVLPIFLDDNGFTNDDVTLILMIYFIADLVMKITFSIITAFRTLKSRNVFLLNMAGTVILRIVFTEKQGFWWTVSLIVLLGCSKSIIQATLPVILAESYSEIFPAAYSLYMVFNGIVSIMLGAIIGFVKHTTKSDVVVLHVLTVACLVCCICWIYELFYKYLQRKWQKGRRRRAV